MQSLPCSNGIFQEFDKDYKNLGTLLNVKSVVLLTSFASYVLAHSPLLIMKNLHQFLAASSLLRSSLTDFQPAIDAARTFLFRCQIH
ncbi:hypothetical protein H6F69_04830 [Leptolyngbya sp. FACHB-1624]|uniref:hypothetical protein n=1 Tax=Leptolyngbya sp. FACHB-1624 TaxID=2692802 RepID=UPI00168431F3|nr:hypothetical protein [Leptolyngbya sp. FACHB-1624]MBD1854941.1 hypothetical protein [Leptolyngbya sp. FACHB-1624]